MRKGGIKGRISGVFSFLQRKSSGILNKSEQITQPEVESVASSVSSATDTVIPSATEKVEVSTLSDARTDNNDKNTNGINEKARQLGINPHTLEKYSNMSNEELIELSRSELGEDGMEDIKAVKAILNERIEEIKYKKLQHELDEVEHLQDELRKELTGQDIGKTFINSLEDNRAVTAVESDLTQTQEKNIN